GVSGGHDVVVHGTHLRRCVRVLDRLAPGSHLVNLRRCPSLWPKPSMSVPRQSHARQVRRVATLPPGSVPGEVLMRARSPSMRITAAAALTVLTAAALAVAALAAAGAAGAAPTAEAAAAAQPVQPSAAGMHTFESL